MGNSIFYRYRGMEVKIQGVLYYDFFKRFLSQGIFFQGGICMVNFFGVEDWNIFLGVIFSRGIESIWHSIPGDLWVNHFLQRVFVFKNFVYTPVWIKNDISQSRWNLQVKHCSPISRNKNSWQEFQRTYPKQS